MEPLGRRGAQRHRPGHIDGPLARRIVVQSPDQPRRQATPSWQVTFPRQQTRQYATPLSNKSLLVAAQFLSVAAFTGADETAGWWLVSKIGA